MVFTEEVTETSELLIRATCLAPHGSQCCYKLMSVDHIPKGVSKVDPPVVMNVICREHYKLVKVWQFKNQQSDLLMCNHGSCRQSFKIIP